MIILEVMLSDALIGGAGGMEAMVLTIFEEEISALQELVIDSRSNKDVPHIFVSKTGTLIDARFVVALGRFDEEDDGGGEEIEDPDMEFPQDPQLGDN